MLADFQICISVPLNGLQEKRVDLWKFLVISCLSGFDLTSKFISNSNFISARGAQETQKQKLISIL